MQAGDDIGGELVGRARDIEHQRVLRFLQIGELPREDGFSGEWPCRRSIWWRISSYDPRK